MKKIFVFLPIAVLFLFLAPQVAEAFPRLFFEEREIAFGEAQPYLDESSRLLVPLRSMGDALGARVEWLAVEDTAILEHSGKTIRLKRNSQLAEVVDIGGASSEFQLLDSPAILLNNRIMVPLRFISEVFGFLVEWQKDTGNIRLSNPSKSTVFGFVLSTDFQPEAEYYPGGEIEVSLEIKNTNPEDREIIAELWLLDYQGRESLLNTEKITLRGSEEKTVSLKTRMPELEQSGRFSPILKIFSLENGQKRELSTRTWREEILAYRYREDFLRFNKSLWNSSEFILERTLFQKANVSVKNGLLMIKLPEGTLNGGELQSKQLHGYGTYEIRMKIPRAPSSITGFFLYKAPCFESEIDIEIYNERNGEIWFSAYSNGEKSSSKPQKLSFDPSTDFHNYRIEYYPERIDFLVDNKLIHSEKNIIPHREMYLLVNTWYPEFLLGKVPDEDAYLMVEWIKY